MFNEYLPAKSCCVHLMACIQNFLYYPSRGLIFQALRGPKASEKLVKFCQKSTKKFIKFCVLNTLTHCSNKVLFNKWQQVSYYALHFDRVVAFVSVILVRLKIDLLEDRCHAVSRLLRPLLLGWQAANWFRSWL